LQKLSKQIEITITAEGLRIELIEDKNGVFYQSGSAKLSESGQELLTLLATELKTLPNELLIEGHTDATQYSTDNNYSNWELSADRANSARRLLQTSGVRADQVTQVRGYADQMLRVKSNPYDPSNRRISMLVKNNVNGAAPPTMKGSEVVGNPMPPAAAKDKESAAKPPSATPAAEAAPLAPPHPQVAAKPLAGTSAATPVPAAKPALAKPGILDKLKSMLPVGKK
jgi:chemotaxis protein MotB